MPSLMTQVYTLVTDVAGPSTHTADYVTVTNQNIYSRFGTWTFCKE